MDQKKQPKTQAKKDQEKFNSVTNSVKPENQNQDHNAVKEGLGPFNRRYS